MGDSPTSDWDKDVYTGGSGINWPKMGTLATANTPSYEDFFFIGADGKGYRYDWLANELAGARTFTGPDAFRNALAYYESTLPKNYFTNSYFGRDRWDNWDLSLLASNDPENEQAKNQNKGLSKMQHEGLSMFGLVLGSTGEWLTYSLKHLGSSRFVFGFNSSGRLLTIILYGDYFMNDFLRLDSRSTYDWYRFSSNTVTFGASWVPYFGVPMGISSYLDATGFYDPYYKKRVDFIESPFNLNSGD